MKVRKPILAAVLSAALPDADRMAYAMAEPEDRYRLAACAPERLAT